MDIERRSKYYYENCDVLLNKLDIKDSKLLDEYERKVVAIKLLLIENVKFSNRFDGNMLKEIHNFLFSEVYDFAGEYREENLAKDEFRFASCDFIASELDRVLGPLKNIENYKNMDKKEAAEKYAYLLSEINVIHPFREGNGRTYREFVRLFAKETGYKLDWSKCEYEEIFEASKKSVYDLEDLTNVIYKCLSKIK